MDGKIEGLPLIVRPFRPSDESFVFASWLNSHAPNRDMRIPRDIYYQEQHALIRELLSTDTFLIAAEKGDPELIFGWLAGAELSIGRVLDYVFVKPTYRRMGVARALLEDFGPIDAYSHAGPVSPRLLPDAVFDPYLLYLPRRKAQK